MVMYMNIDEIEKIFPFIFNKQFIEIYVLRIKKLIQDVITDKTAPFAPYKGIKYSADRIPNIDDVVDIRM